MGVGVCLGHGRPVGWQVSGCVCGGMTGTWEASGSAGECVCVWVCMTGTWEASGSVGEWVWVWVWGYDWDMGGQWVGR